MGGLIPNNELIDNLPQILEMNSVDVILVPRVNLVDGLTDEVHEKLEGYDTISNLPWVEELSLFHHKDIDKQIKQNDYYDTLV